MKYKSKCYCTMNFLNTYVTEINNLLYLGILVITILYIPFYL